MTTHVSLAWHCFALESVICSWSDIGKLQDCSLQRSRVNIVQGFWDEKGPTWPLHRRNDLHIGWVLPTQPPVKPLIALGLPFLLHWGYIFMDAFSLPQVFGTDSLDLSMEMSNQTEAASAVQSIPAYVERCDLFIVLAPDPWHNRHNSTLWTLVKASDTILI